MLNASAAKPVEAPLTLSLAAACEKILRLLTLPGHGVESSTPSFRAKSRNPATPGLGGPAVLFWMLRLRAASQGAHSVTGGVRAWQGANVS